MSHSFFILFFFLDEQVKQYEDDVWNMRIVGCFAMTELGHSSFLRGIVKFWNDFSLIFVLLIKYSWVWLLSIEGSLFKIIVISFPLVLNIFFCFTFEAKLHYFFLVIILIIFLFFRARNYCYFWPSNRWIYNTQVYHWLLIIFQYTNKCFFSPSLLSTKIWIGMAGEVVFFVSFFLSFLFVT